MKRLLPTEVRIASLGPTGPRFWTGSSPRTGRLYPPRMTRPPTAAQIDNLLRANMMDLLVVDSDSSELEESLHYFSEIRCGDCHKVWTFSCAGLLENGRSP